MSSFDVQTLLTPGQMALADELAICAGLSGETLMRNAARAVADAAMQMAAGSGADGSIAILAGGGKNGGDAYGAAELLRGNGRTVELFATGRERLEGEARVMAAEWGPDVRPLEAFDPSGFDLVIDGLLGAGLSRDVDGPIAAALRRLSAGKARVLAIDLPSGISGSDGSVRGIAARAERTVTFFRRKPGHLLQPGRSHCGTVEVAEIGIRSAVLDEIGARTFANEPGLFRARLLAPVDTHHKYDRGHAVVFSGPASKTGAARMAAMAALRGGAGLVTVFSSASAVLVNAAHLTAIMLRRCDDAAELAEHLRDDRLSTFVLGPGFGDPQRARAYAGAILAAGRKLVLDADGLTAFADDPDELFRQVRGEIVFTPHDGEFARLFPDLAGRRSKLDRARDAAARSGAVIVLKGSDTVIASPDGRAAINGNAPANLATAGTGDVLCGLVAAQLANGVPAFESACAAVWLHARAAASFGPGLIAEDLPGLVPSALETLSRA